jgi:hypothetical protein
MPSTAAWPRKSSTSESEHWLARRTPCCWNDLSPGATRPGRQLSAHFVERHSPMVLCVRQNVLDCFGLWAGKIRRLAVPIRSDARTETFLIGMEELNS